MATKKRDTTPNKDKLVSSVLELHKQKHKAHTNGDKPKAQFKVGLDKFRGLLGRQLKAKIKDTEHKHKNIPPKKP